MESSIANLYLSMDGRIDNGISWDCPWDIHGLSLQYLWVVHRLPPDPAHGSSVDSSGIAPGLPVVFPWTIRGLIKLESGVIRGLCTEIPNSQIFGLVDVGWFITLPHVSNIFF